MSTPVTTVSEVKAASKQVSQSLGNVSRIADIVDAIAAAELPIKVRRTALTAARRLFTTFFHDGVMAGTGLSARDHAGSSSDKSKAKAATAAKSAAEALASWLRDEYRRFRAALLPCMLETEEAAENLGVAALATSAHFCAHACSSKVQTHERGLHFCLDTMDWLLRHLLCAYTKEELPPAYRGSGAAPAGAGSSAPVLPTEHVRAVRAGAQRGGASAREMVRRTLLAFRSQYIDDYDDARYYACTAVAGLAREKVRLLGKPASATSDPLQLCPAPLFLRAAVALLLEITLPSSEWEWEAATHDSLVRSQWEGVLPQLYDTAAAGNDGKDESAPAAKRVRLYNADDDSDEDTPQQGAGGGKPGKGPEKGSAAGAAKGKHSKARAAAAASSDFGDVGEGIQPLSQGAGAGAAKRKRAPAPRPAAPAARGAGTGGDDDDDGLDLDAIRLDDPAPAADSGAAASNEAAPSAPAAPRFTQLSEQRRVYSEAWVAVLQLAGSLSGASAAATSGSDGVASLLPPDVLRRILVALPTRVLPHMPSSQPLLLADFLTACLDAGGVVALLAVEALFWLMNNQGLEYPHFYRRLYAMLTPEAVHAKHRARFFKLLDMCLSSAALPAYLVAAFMKRAARLALTAAAPFALFALPFVYNCLKRHPACAPLLHKEVESAAAATAAAWPAPADPFDPHTADPAACRALESSLWELTALSTHYFPPVAYLARVFLKGEPVKAEYDVVGEYAGNVYAALVAAELARTRRQAGATSVVGVPFAFARLPAKLAATGGNAAVVEGCAASTIFDGAAAFE